MAAAGMVLAGWLLATVVRHGGRAVYDLPGWAVALGVGAALASFLGWAVLVRTGGWFGLGVAVLGALIIASIVTVPVIGVVLVVVGIAWMAKASQERPQKAALAGGLLVAIGFPVAALVASDGPVVECRDGGVSTSSSIFRDADGSSGSGSSGSTGASIDGTVVNGGRRFAYRCDGARLAEFRLVP